MKEQIAAVVEDLRSNPRVSIFRRGRGQTGHHPAITGCSWLGSATIVDEIAPDYGVEDGKVDYALRLASDNKVFIAAKRSAKRFPTSTNSDSSTTVRSSEAYSSPY